MHVKAGQTPSDEFALDVSASEAMCLPVTLTYQTLTVFLAGVLSKRYTNPSSDIIMVLAGLETVDSVFTDFANALETAIRNGKSRMLSISFEFRVLNLSERKFDGRLLTLPSL